MNVQSRDETPEGRDYAWLRTHHLGGRLAIPGHGRQYFRFSALDFRPRDGLSPDWPVTLSELSAWYARVEHLLGLQGNLDGVADVPDSEIASPIEASPAESELRAKIHDHWPGTPVLAGRFAPPPDNLGAGAATDRLWVRRGAIVREVLAGPDGRTRGVAWHDRASGQRLEAKAPIVFCCASPIESARILMLSHAPLSPDGIGARSGMLGRNLMDHLLVKAEGVGPRLRGDGATPPDGRCSFLPRLDRTVEPQVYGDRGFGVQLYRTPADGDRSWFIAVGFGERLPETRNHVRLHPTRKDAWGIPALIIDAALSNRDLAMAATMGRALNDLAGLCDARLSLLPDRPAVPGTSAHECGTARMAARPEDGVLDPLNQCWDMPGLFVTDAACFASQGCQNPTLTVLALTARACDHVVRERGRGKRA